MAEEIVEDLKLHEEQDGSIVVGGSPAEPEAPNEEDETPVKATSEEEHHEEEQASEGESADEAEERRERNRKRRTENKERRKEYVESLRRELAARDSIINELSQRVATVERKSSGSEMAQLDNAEKEALHYYNQFKQLNSQAINSADGAMAIDAQEKMFAARQRLEQIKNIRQAMSHKQNAPAALDPRLVSNANDWMERNSWYDPSGKDMDSRVTMTLDKQLAEEGWNPVTEQYWEELESRVRKYLPHRTGSGYNKSQGSVEKTRTAPRVPVAGSGKESAASPKGGYKLSADRVQALKDSGMWDDPKQRAEAIKRFQDYDKTEGAR